MPVFDEEPQPAPCPQVEPTKHTPEAYRGVTVDTKFTPRESLLTHLEGQAWQIDYYHQVITRDSGTKGQQIGLNGVYQPYELIRGLEIKVTSPLSAVKDETNKEFATGGSANFYAITNLVPNEGDMFIADIGDGNEGVFQITKAVKKTMFSSSPYEIDYIMIDDNDHVRSSDLNGKVVSTKLFRLDYLRDGYNPLLSDGQAHAIVDLEDTYQRLLAFYFADFYSREHRTLIVPNQGLATYDPFVTKFIANIIDITAHPLMAELTQLNVSQDQAMYEMTIWNCLERLDVRMMQIVAQEMGIVPVKQFYTRPMFNSVYYTKIKQVVYPCQFPTNVDEGYKRHRPRPATEPYHEGSVRFRELKRQIPITDLITDTAEGPYYHDESDMQPHIKAVTEDSYYVFSEEFYNHVRSKVPLSKLEHLTLTALKGEKIDVVKLLDVCETAMDWDNVERFYFFPVLFLLMNVYPRAL